MFKMLHIVFAIYSIIGDYYHLKLHHIWININTFGWKKEKIIFELIINIKIEKGNRLVEQIQCNIGSMLLEDVSNKNNNLSISLLSSIWYSNYLHMPKMICNLIMVQYFTIYHMNERNVNFNLMGNISSLIHFPN
jgi:disulfide bond formation protein DsbB